MSDTAVLPLAPSSSSSSSSSTSSSSSSSASRVIVVSPPSVDNYTPVSEIPKRLAEQRAYFGTHVTKSKKWRKEQLNNVLRMMCENEEAITTALQTDLNKPPFESLFAEIANIETETRAMLSELDDWMKPVSYPTPAALLPGKSYVMRDPYGVVLIIAPFNYPVQLSILPLIAALAGGNCAVIKPSELTPASTALLSELIPKYLDKSAVCVVTGAIPETTALLQQKWDYIFFTGSDIVGKIVARAAAEHLTPVTLELGGKSPVIVNEDADLTLAARRMIWGKVYNSGQSCIAPDYVFVHSSVQTQFQEECKRTLKQFFSDNVSTSPDFARIVSDRHTKRLVGLINSLKADNIVIGGHYDIESKYIEPTIVRSTVDDPVMKEEIFGPILPMITFDDLATVLTHINSQPKPLALYIFSTDSDFTNRVLNETSSGGVSINDVMMHFANSHLPFGGVGTSGMGAYHGKFGFDTFTHAKAVLHKSVYADAPARYPPYTDFNKKLFRFASEIEKVNSHTFSKGAKWVLLPCLFILIVAIILWKCGLKLRFE